jgi:very-short-patch-repair endonuclease
VNDVAGLARWQGGVIGRDQLISAGLSPLAIDARVRAGRYVRRHRGVYDIAGAAIGMRGRSFAALLAGGGGAVLSFRLSAANWLLSPEPPVPEITVPGRHVRSRPDLVVHRSTTLSCADVVERAGLTMTTPLRTLLDMATVESRASLERIVAEALVLRLLDARLIREAAGHPGARRLRAALDGPDATLSHSELERIMVRLIRDAGLPPPQAQTLIAAHRADFAWPDRRLIVEVDGWAAHGHRLAFERDRARDLAHTLAGFTVVRFTYRQIVSHPRLVALRLAALLEARSPSHGRER